MDENAKLCTLLCRLLAHHARAGIQRPSFDLVFKELDPDKPLATVLRLLNELERSSYPGTNFSLLPGDYTKATVESIQARLDHIEQSPLKTYGSALLSSKKLEEYQLAPVDIAAPPSTCACSLLRGISFSSIMPKAPARLFEICALCTEDSSEKGNLCETRRCREVCFLMSYWFGYRGFLPPQAMLNKPLQSAVALFDMLQGVSQTPNFRPPQMGVRPTGHPPPPQNQCPQYTPPRPASSAASSVASLPPREGFWGRLKRAWKVIVNRKKHDVGSDTDSDFSRKFAD